MDYAEIVDADVRELGTTCDLADRPDAVRGGLQPLIDLYISPLGELNAGQFQSESRGVWSAPCRDKQVRIRHHLIGSILFEHNGYRVSRFSRHAFDECIQMNIDALVVKQAVKSHAHVCVFFGHQSCITINHSHFAAEAAHRLGHLYSDV